MDTKKGEPLAGERRMSLVPAGKDGQREAQQQSHSGDRRVGSMS